MGYQETRSIQRADYFQLLMARHTGKLDAAFGHFESSMEPEDVALVQKRFNAFIEEQNKKEAGE